MFYLKKRQQTTQSKATIQNLAWIRSSGSFARPTRCFYTNTERQSQTHISILFYVQTYSWPDWPVDELLQAHSSLLDEGLLKNALVCTERQLSLQGFPRQGRYYNLWVTGADTTTGKMKTPTTKRHPKSTLTGVWVPFRSFVCEVTTRLWFTGSFCIVQNESLTINVHNNTQRNMLFQL